MNNEDSIRVAFPGVKYDPQEFELWKDVYLATQLDNVNSNIAAHRADESVRHLRKSFEKEF